MTVSNIGMRTNLMNPIWAVGLVTLSLSMKGATGRPSDFSLSLWEAHTGMFFWLKTAEFTSNRWQCTFPFTPSRHVGFRLVDFWSYVNALVEVTCMKYSSRRQSTHGSATSVGLTSLEISQHLIKTIFSWKHKHTWTNTCSPHAG